MSVSDRIKEYRDLKNIGIKEFEKKCGLSNAYLNKVKSPGGEILEHILKNCPDLNREYVLTGIGNMIKSDSEYSIPKDILNTTEEKEVEIEPDCQACKAKDAHIKALEGELYFLKQIIERQYLDRPLDTPEAGHG